MSDHSELKKAAEACGDLNWRFLTEKLTEYGIRDDHGYIAFLPVGHPAKYGPCPEREAKARFLGAMTPAVVLTMISDLERNQRMLLAACVDIGAIGNALKADMNADGDDLLGMVIDLKAQNSRMLGWLKDISKTSGDKGAVMGARQLLKEFDKGDRT